MSTTKFGDETVIRLETDARIGPFEDGLCDTPYVVTEKNGDTHRGVVSHRRDEADAEVAQMAYNEWRKAKS